MVKLAEYERYFLFELAQMLIALGAQDVWRMEAPFKQTVNESLQCKYEGYTIDIHYMNGRLSIVYLNQAGVPKGDEATPRLFDVTDGWQERNMGGAYEEKANQKLKALRDLLTNIILSVLVIEEKERERSTTRRKEGLIK